MRNSFSLNPDDSVGGWLEQWLPPRRFFLFLVIYLLVQVLSRAAASPILDLDEAEQAFNAQALAPGYGPQPPLYSWCQYLAFLLFGKSIAALIGLKAIFLMGLYGMTYRVGCLLSDRRAGGIAAVISLFMVPQIFWESLRDLSNSVLVTLAAVWTWYAVFRSLRDPGPRSVALLSLGIAIGILAKANYLIFLGSLGLVWALRPQLRQKIGWKTWALSLFFGVAIAAPYLDWLIRHPEMGFSSASKIDMMGIFPGVDRMAAAFLNFLKAVFTHLWLLVLVWFVLLGKKAYGLWTAWREGNLEYRWLIEQALWAIGILWVVMTVTGAIGFRDRWLLPICVGLPIYAGAVGIRFLGKRSAIGLLVWGALVCLGVTLAYPARFAYPIRFRQMRLALPVDEAARTLRRIYPEARVIITDDVWLAGNFTLAPEGFHTVVLGRPVLVPARFRPALIVWNLDCSEDPPKELLQFAAQLTRGQLDQKAEQILRFHRNAPHAPTLRLGVIPVRMAW